MQCPCVVVLTCCADAQSTPSYGQRLRGAASCFTISGAEGVEEAEEVEEAEG